MARTKGLNMTMFHDYSTQWTFKTRNFTVRLAIQEQYGYQYDGEDSDGIIQDKLDDGTYVAFDSVVEVQDNIGRTLGWEFLGSSVYDASEVSRFWTDHRDPDPANRNTLAMKAQKRAVCHYFPELVRMACQHARSMVHRHAAVLHDV